MKTLTLLAHSSSEVHTHADGVAFIILGMVIVALLFHWRRTV